MCGIFGYIGKDKKQASLVLEGLKSLEYRGYDSWGIVVNHNGKLKRERHTGKIGQSRTILPESDTAMGHTRWATHGGVTEANAHPHFDCSGRFAVVHNGIIENEKELRKLLIKKGHKFTSQTDTEIIAHLLEEETKKYHGNLSQLVSLIAAKLDGAFALGVMDRDRPSEAVLARFGGPLVIGLTEGYKLFASDPSALLPFTRQVIYLKDREIAWITPDNVEIMSFDNQKKRSSVTTLDWNVEKIKKDGYAHYMLKEIMEQPESLMNTMRGRIDIKGKVKLGGLEAVKDLLRDVEFIRFMGCGTAGYAGMVGAIILQELTPVVSHMEVSSEFNYSQLNWPKNSVAWFVTQSGETADVLISIDKVKSERIIPLGLVNVVGSSVAQRTTAGVYLHAGPEIAVASTKAFTSQIAALAMISCWLRQNRSNGRNGYSKSADLGMSLLKLPLAVAKTLKLRPQVKKLAKLLSGASQILFFGRGVYYPLALEAALKLREVAYFNTIGLPLGELKHGPISAMDKNRPAVVFAPFDKTIDKSRSNIQELLARDIPTFVITDKAGGKKLSDLSCEIIEVPVVHELLGPVTMAVVVQLLAYEMGLLLNRPIDKPRNLAKSVTVE
ncbi:glutamine--fructose-6-phosphate transaminase (isomerizing) [Candidatus Collierbacteria bacterium]|nr:glutamine--fructose-6-phosphate transaminase (isomerizing) [Candidatus Collierbacteria bacterium]